MVQRAVLWSLWIAIVLGASFGDVEQAEALEAGAVLGGGGLPLLPLGELHLVSEGDVTPRLKQLRKDVRQALRRFRRVVARSLRVWVTWLPGIVGGFIWVLLVGAWNRGVVERGLAGDARALWANMRRGAIVYLRLLRDRQTPAVGKALIVVGLIYTAAPRDLVWDTRGFAGMLEDAVLLTIVARSFLRMCSQEAVERHARAVVRREQRYRGTRSYGGGAQPHPGTSEWSGDPTHSG